MRVELDCVSKSFLGCRALDDITLTIEPGSLVAVVDVNGAGKSTLLRCLATLLYLTRGQIKLDGELLRRSRLDLRKRLHFVPDNVRGDFGTDAVQRLMSVACPFRLVNCVIRLQQLLLRKTLP